MIELLNKRINYYGGNQQQRMSNDKVRSIKKAFLYSYQAETAILPDGRQFRCLINPDKNKPQYDNKVISILFKDICLNTPKIGKTNQGEVNTNIKCGDVFIWKENQSHWLVYLQNLEETAYFRSQIRRCDQTVKVNDNQYWVYIRGPVQTSIEWTQKSKVEWNTMNYSLVMYITADDNTCQYFNRFKTIKIYSPKYKTEKTWQVVGVDPYYGDGIIQIFLDEWYENSIADAVAAQKLAETSPIEELDQDAAYINGPLQVSRYSKAYYEIVNAKNGNWFIKYNNQQKDLNSDMKIIPLQINNDNVKQFILIYRIENQDDITLKVKINSI